MLVFFYFFSMMSVMLSASASMHIADLKALWRSEYQKNAEYYAHKNTNLVIKQFLRSDNQESLDRSKFPPEMIKRAQDLFETTHVDGVIFTNDEPSLEDRVLRFSMNKKRMIYVNSQERDAIKLERDVFAQVIDAPAKNPDFPAFPRINKDFGFFPQGTRDHTLLRAAYFLYAFVPVNAYLPNMHVDTVARFWIDFASDKYPNVMKIFKMSGIRTSEIQGAFEALKRVFDAHPPEGTYTVHSSREKAYGVSPEGEDMEAMRGRRNALNPLRVSRPSHGASPEGEDMEAMRGRRNALNPSRVSRPSH